MTTQSRTPIRLLESRHLLVDLRHLRRHGAFVYGQIEQTYTLIPSDDNFLVDVETADGLIRLPHTVLARACGRLAVAQDTTDTLAGLIHFVDRASFGFEARGHLHV